MLFFWSVPYVQTELGKILRIFYKSEIEFIYEKRGEWNLFDYIHCRKMVYIYYRRRGLDVHEVFDFFDRLNVLA